jgi:hypothetical protein
MHKVFKSHHVYDDQTQVSGAVFCFFPDNFNMYCLLQFGVCVAEYLGIVKPYTFVLRPNLCMVEEIEIYIGYVIPQHIIINMLHRFQVLGLNVFFSQYFEVALFKLTFIQIGGNMM